MQDVLQEKQLFVLQAAIKNIDAHSRFLLLGAVTAVAKVLQDGLHVFPESRFQSLSLRNLLGVSNSREDPEGKRKNAR